MVYFQKKISGPIMEFSLFFLKKNLNPYLILGAKNIFPKSAQKGREGGGSDALVIKITFVSLS